MKSKRIYVVFSVVMFALSGCTTTTTSVVVQSEEGVTTADSNTVICARKLDSKYTIKNKSGLFSETPTWKPVKVYDDGVSVYIKMPPGCHVKPTLFILDDKKHPWELNYQINKHYYRVDYLFTRAQLVMGEEKIEISKK